MQNLAQPTATLFAALLAATVTAVGWYVSYIYTRRKDDATRRLEIHLRYRQRQIEELYGPLSSLIQQIFNVWQVRENILQSDRGTLSDEQRSRIRELFWQSYFKPLHQEVHTLLRTKLYLLDGARIPDSFLEYLEHSTQEEAQRRLWEEARIDTSFAEGRSWPQRFNSDVEAALNSLLSDVQGGIYSLMISRSQHRQPNEL